MQYTLNKAWQNKKKTPTERKREGPIDVRACFEKALKTSPRRGTLLVVVRHLDSTPKTDRHFGRKNPLSFLHTYANLHNYRFFKLWAGYLGASYHACRLVYSLDTKLQSLWDAGEQESIPEPLSTSASLHRHAASTRTDAKEYYLLCLSELAHVRRSIFGHGFQSW